MKIGALIVVAASLAAVSPASAADQYAFSGTGAGNAVTLTLDGVTPSVAVDMGWIDDSGAHNAGNQTYITGTAGSTSYNSYFSFVLGALTSASPYTTATLTFSTGKVVGTPFTLSLFDVSASAAALTQQRFSGDADGQAIYNDLASGTSYGSYAFTATPSTSTVTVALDQAFLDQINYNGLRTFSIGGTLSPAAAAAAVPEPASWAMMLLGFAVAGIGLRKQARRPHDGRDGTAGPMSLRSSA